MRVAAFLVAAFCACIQAGEIPLAERRSGYEFMGRETRAMQDDDTTNPALFALQDGEALWNRRDREQSCASCHGDATASMKGVAARYPAIVGGKPINLEQRINACRLEHQHAPAFAYESKELLALTAYVGRQSRGMPIAIEANDATRPHIEAGRALYERREGQLNLACSQCHDDNWGKLLAGSPIPQGHATGYPIYRLEWQGMGSLERRVRNCMIGVRAEPYAYGSLEYVQLELYLMWRARGMKLETPAVRP
ncbi:MAG TPA: sulfur oxidation c-type cytochrome SoxA [Burkholderiales bacterium]|nr:sulfur oxidation c-type cytochrome SoxA [Burkholderiales bacterium]